MKKSPGFNLSENLLLLLLALVIVVFVAQIFVPSSIISSLDKSKLTSTAASATAIVKLSSLIQSDQDKPLANLTAWPGTNSASMARWMNSLTNYASTNDLMKIFSAGEVKVTSWRADAGPNVQAFYIYPATEDSSSDTVLITSRNLLLPTYGRGPGLVAAAKPFGNKGAIVVKKGGSAEVITARAATNDVRSIGLVGGAPLN